VAELGRIAAFAATLSAVEQVHVLPYHRLGRERRERLGLPLLKTDPQPPGSEAIAAAAATFERWGLETQIGG
jgi:pyruvate formate lyase activating enzyme